MKQFLVRLPLILISCGLAGCGDSKSDDYNSQPEPEVPNNAEFRTFTSVDGKKVEGKLIQFDDDQVTLQRADGLTFRFPIDTLSIADQAFVEKAFAAEASTIDRSLETTDQTKIFSEELSIGEVSLAEETRTVTFSSPNGGGSVRYAFPPEQKARFDELRRHLEAGRKVKFGWRNLHDQILDLDFSVAGTGDPSLNPAVPTTNPSPLLESESFVLWLTKDEVENPQLESTSIQGDISFAQTLKTTLNRIVETKGQTFVWETDYIGPQALVGASPMDGSQRFVVTHDARVKELLGVDRYTLETPREEGSSLFLRFLFKSASEVELVFENQRARNAVSRGVVLRLPDLKTKRHLDLYLLSPNVISAKPNELPKSHLSLDRNRVTLFKSGALRHGLRAVGSTGPLILKLSAHPSEGVFLGSELRPIDFTNRGLGFFPDLWIKPVPEDSFTCELSLFIDYMMRLRMDFQRAIANFNEVASDELGAKMPVPRIYEAVEKFGERAEYPRGNYKSGSGKGTYGPFMIDVVVRFFRQTHEYAPPAAEKLKRDLTPDPKSFVYDDAQYREFWKNVCERVKREAFAPFGPADDQVLSPFQKKAYDPKNLSRDIDRVIGTLRFLREAERTFGIKDQGVDNVISTTVRELMNRENGAIKKLYDQLLVHKATPEARAATPKYTSEWNKYLREFAQLRAPAELTAAELRKAINCIEDDNLAKAFGQVGTTSETSQPQLGPLKQWQALLEKKIAKKDPRVVPNEYQPASKVRLMESYFQAETWSLSLFREGQIEPEAELILFK